MVVYPKSLKVQRSIFEAMRKEFSSLGGLVAMQTEDAKEVELKFPSKEAMAVHCLQFYLKPYENELLQDEEYPKDFKVDTIVTEISHIYSLLHEPWLQFYRHSIPLATPVSSQL